MADLAPSVCSVCGNPVPPGAEACPIDGNTLFVGPGQVPDSLVGMQLGEYVVKERVGEGGMSDVYAGLQPVIMKKVAIKVLKPEMAQDKTQVQRLVTEAVAVNSIGHRNIIDIFSNGTLPDGRAYVVMEFLDGEGLDVYLQRMGVLQPLEAVELLIDICAPLAAAHAKGVIHRDLKPSNVYLVNQPDGTRFLKLLDFGLAKQSLSIDGKTSQTSVHQIAGTPDYMAPEQARGQDVSPLTDLYSLGVLAFQLLTGRLPFVADTPMDVMMMQVSAVPPLVSAYVPDVMLELDQLVAQLMDKDPARRPPSAEVVRAELKQFGMTLRTTGAVGHRVWTGELPAVFPPTATPPADSRPARPRRGDAVRRTGAIALATRAGAAGRRRARGAGGSRAPLLPATAGHCPGGCRPATPRRRARPCRGAARSAGRARPRAGAAHRGGAPHRQAG